MLEFEDSIEFAKLFIGAVVLASALSAYFWVHARGIHIA